MPCLVTLVHITLFLPLLFNTGGAYGGTDYFPHVYQLSEATKFRTSTVRQPRNVSLGAQYHSGQVLFKFVLSKPLEKRKLGTHVVKVTTCSSFTNFDTVLFAFQSSAELNFSQGAHLPPPFDLNDNDCNLQSTLELPLPTNHHLYLLVTGFGTAEGYFEIGADIVPYRTKKSIPWGLDRIDQRALPLDSTFSVSNGGAGVYVYILDSGIRTSHSEFRDTQGVRRALFGTDLVDHRDYAFDAYDATGHGTHVAGIIGGQTFGVAKRATLVSVRVLDRNGLGYAARLVQGLEWSLSDMRVKKRWPALVVMAMTSTFSASLNHAVRATSRHGVIVVTAAGNNHNDSCLYSPASEQAAITVASVNENDFQSKFSNYGACVDIYAPGEHIQSAWHTGDLATRAQSGTSFACPHVAGTVATLLGDNPSLSPSELSSVLFMTSSTSVVKSIPNGGKKASPAANDDGVAKVKNSLVYVRPLPSMAQNVRPNNGKMFIYAVFEVAPSATRAATVLCSSKPDREASIKQLFLENTGTESIKPKVSATLCCLSESRESCEISSVSSQGLRVVIQLTVDDHNARTVFNLFEVFSTSTTGLGHLRNIVHGDVSVLYPPWVVDSRGFKYWAAPSFLEKNTQQIRGGQAILIACGIFLALLLVVCAFVFFLYRRRVAERIAQKEEFERKAAEFENSTQKLSNLTDVRQIPTQQRREGMKRVNTDLFGDVLRNISTARGLRTPRIFGGRTPRTPDCTRRAENHDPYCPQLSKDATKPQEDNCPECSSPQTKSQCGQGETTPSSPSAPPNRPSGSSAHDRERHGGAYEALQQFAARVYTPSRANRRTLSFGPGRGATVQLSPLRSASLFNSDDAQPETGDIAPRQDRISDA